MPRTSRIFLKKSVLFVAKTQSLTAAATTYLSVDYVFVFVSMLRQILREKKMFVHILDCVRYRFISDINTRNCHTRENAAQFAAALLQASAICTQYFVNVKFRRINRIRDVFFGNYQDKILINKRKINYFILFMLIIKVIVKKILHCLFR